MPEESTLHHVLVDLDSTPSVAILTLNRPEAMNAMNTRMAEEIVACFADFAMRSNLRSVVLTGGGTRAFCPGADLKERAGMTDVEWHAQHRIFQAAAKSILRCEVPVIAAVEGFALGGGFELALMADFIVAGEDATFGFPEATRGLIPGIGGSQLLPRTIRRQLAKELVYTGRRIDAAEALQQGLINHLAPAGSAVAKAVELAQRISANAPIAIRQAKKVMTYGPEVDLDTALVLAVEAYRATVASNDRREGVLAFNEKRAPVFAGN